MPVSNIVCFGIVCVSGQREINTVLEKLLFAFALFSFWHLQPYLTFGDEKELANHKHTETDKVYHFQVLRTATC